MIKANTATKVKKYLKDNGIKIGFLAQKLNKTPGEMSNILNGRQRLYADDFIDITKVLNVKPDDIIQINLDKED